MKKRILKNWVVKVLGGIVASYVMFLMLTIDSLGNATYNKILAIYSILAIVSYKILNKYSNVFED